MIAVVAGVREARWLARRQGLLPFEVRISWLMAEHLGRIAPERFALPREMGGRVGEIFRLPVRVERGGGQPLLNASRPGTDGAVSYILRHPTRGTDWR